MGVTNAPCPSRRFTLECHPFHSHHNQRQSLMVTTAAGLSDVRVLDLSQDIAGPYAAHLLGAFGADVMKVEPPGVGDRTRRRGPFADDIPDPNRRRAIPVPQPQQARRNPGLEHAHGLPSRAQAHRPGRRGDRQLRAGQPPVPRFSRAAGCGRTTRRLSSRPSPTSGAPGLTAATGAANW